MSGDEIKKEVRERTMGYITAALGLVAGLAWNDAITSLINFLFPVSKGGLFIKFFYAAAITVAVVVLTVYLTRLLRKDTSR